MKFNRWIAPLYLRWLIRQRAVVVVVGAARSGKTRLLERAGVTRLEGDWQHPGLIPSGTLPAGPLALDEVHMFDRGWVANTLADLSDRGFAISVQNVHTLDQIGVTEKLVARPRVEFIYLDNGDGRQSDATLTWIARSWEKTLTFARQV